MDFESNNGSFKDAQDTSLRLSLYANKPSHSHPLNNTIELDKLLQNEYNREGISEHIRMIIEKTKDSQSKYWETINGVNSQEQWNIDLVVSI